MKVTLDNSCQRIGFYIDFVPVSSSQLTQELKVSTALSCGLVYILSRHVSRFDNWLEVVGAEDVLGDIAI
jgi:hypothetical protein